jgi:hypothetical protein
MAICYTVYTLVWALVHRARWLGSPCKLCTCVYVSLCSLLGSVFSRLFRVNVSRSGRGCGSSCLVGRW